MGQLLGLICVCVCVCTKYLPLMSAGSVTHVKHSELNVNAVNVDSPQFRTQVRAGECLVFLPFSSEITFILSSLSVEFIGT